MFPNMLFFILVYLYMSHWTYNLQLISHNTDNYVRHQNILYRKLVWNSSAATENFSFKISNNTSNDYHSWQQDLRTEYWWREISNRKTAVKNKKFYHLIIVNRHLVILSSVSIDKFLNTSFSINILFYYWSTGFSK